MTAALSLSTCLLPMPPWLVCDAVGGVYAQRVFVELLGASADSLSNCTPLPVRASAPAVAAAVCGACRVQVRVCVSHDYVGVEQDFGGGHPDPNLTYAHDLVEAMGTTLQSASRGCLATRPPGLRAICCACQALLLLALPRRVLRTARCPTLELLRVRACVQLVHPRGQRSKLTYVYAEQTVMLTAT